MRKMLSKGQRDRGTKGQRRQGAGNRTERPREMSNHVNDGETRRYQSQWQAYRARRNWLGLVLCIEFLAFIPFMALMERVFRHFVPAGNFAFLAASAIVATLYLFTVSRLRSFPCPRCGKNYFGGFFARPGTVLGRNCGNVAFAGTTESSGMSAKFRHAIRLLAAFG